MKMNERTLMWGVLLAAGLYMIEDRVRHPWRCRTYATCFPKYPR